MTRKVAWGYIEMNCERESEILIATRSKTDDPLRQGEFVIPGGGVEPGETYVDAAIREVLTETGIDTLRESAITVSFPDITYKDNKIDCIVHGETIQIKYLDSGKQYEGKVIKLKPKDPAQKPTAQPGSDASNPEYVTKRCLEYERFTPACSLLLRLLSA